MKLIGALVGMILGAASAASSVSAQPALGLESVYSRPSGWTVGLNSTGGCLSVATYRDGTTVWFGFASAGQSVLAFTNPEWKSINPNQKYQIELRARGRGTWRGTFTGVERRGERGIFAAGLKNELLVDLAAAGGIHVRFEGREVARLSLSGSAAALRDTLGCQTNVGGRPTQAATQTAPKKEPPKPESKGSSGTGFFVSATGHILTNHHVIDGCKVFRVGVPGAPATPARVVASDSTNDLALLKVDLTATGVAAFDSRPRLGSSVYVYGFPLGGILATTGNFTSGAITATAGMADDTRLLQISAPVQPGNSGGPVKDQSGNIVGVVVSKLNALKIAQVTNDVPQNVNFAIKSYIAVNFLESHGVTPKVAGAPKPLDPADIADEAKKFTLRVTCD